MYILQISDLHLSNQSNIEVLLCKTMLLCNKINELKNESDSQIVCCILGDLVDKGDQNSYDKVRIILESLRENLNKSFGAENVRFLLLPGNHDLCTERKKKKTLTAFNKFAVQFLGFNEVDSTFSSIKESDWRLA